MEAGQSNSTLYVQNLNDRVKKAELKVSLYFLFSQFGEVIDIVTKKCDRMRGQAFIVFADFHSADLAKKALNNFNIFEKNMVSYDLGRKLALQ
jgi:U2 small nuclear ribonucleoprotein B''